MQRDSPFTEIGDGAGDLGDGSAEPVAADQQSENVELAVIAQRLVQEAVRRAHATTATPDRRTSRCRRPHHLRHRRQDRLAGLGFGDQATRQLGQVIAVGSRVAAQQREGIVDRTSRRWERNPLA